MHRRKYHLSLFFVLASHLCVDSWQLHILWISISFQRSLQTCCQSLFLNSPHRESVCRSRFSHRRYLLRWLEPLMIVSVSFRSGRKKEHRHRCFFRNIHSISADHQRRRDDCGLFYFCSAKSNHSVI